MAIGPGKYDAICTQALEQTNAKAAVVIIIQGNKGDGFSAQFLVESDRERRILLGSLGGVLRHMAKQIDSDAQFIDSTPKPESKSR
jgi:hypothetical protein